MSHTNLYNTAGSHGPYKVLPAPRLGVAAQTPESPSFPNPGSNAMITTFYGQFMRRYSLGMDTLQRGADAMLAVDKYISQNYEGLITDYDREVVLPSTVPMGFMKPHHYDLDEKCQVGVPRKFLFPDDVVQRTIKHLRALIPSEPDRSLTMKRGTNLGYPTPKSGRTRDESDFLLALHCALAVGGRVRGLSLREISQFLQPHYGPAFCKAGERFQVTEKVMPIYVNGTWYESTNLEMRARMILPSPKYCVAYNRPQIKRGLSAIMKSPHHPQDRGVLSSFFSARPGDCYLALDVSRFDQSHGLAAGGQLLKIWGDILGLSPQDLDSWVYEFTIPLLIPSFNRLNLVPGGRILSSGVSMTTIIGCLASHMLCLYLIQAAGMSVDEGNANGGGKVGFVSWGDDIVLRFPSAERKKQFKSDLERLSSLVELKFDEEPTVKFLGQNYHMNGFSAPTAYPFGRFIQQNFFPERIKEYPFSDIGFCARVQLLHPDIRKTVISKQCVNPQIYRCREAYPDPASAILRLSEVAAKSGEKITQLDEIFGTLIHGLQLDDAVGLDLGVDDSLLELLGSTTADVSDPAQFLSDNPDVNKSLLSCVQRLQNGDLAYFVEALRLYTRIKGYRLVEGLPYY